jgi:hypothetical protein
MENYFMESITSVLECSVDNRSALQPNIQFAKACFIKV